MKQVKRLGRGLEDFSHLFLSSKSGKSEHSTGGTHDAVSEPEGARILPRVICITSDRRVGERAFLTVNLACELAERGKRVLVFDADFSLPRLCMLMDIPARGSMLQFITKNGKEEVIAGGKEELKLITLDVDISDLRSLGEHERSTLIQCFRRAEEEADIMLINASPGFIHHMRAILKAVAEVIVVTPQQVAEMINAYGVIKFIFQVNADAQVGIVSSRIANPPQAEVVFEKMQRIVKMFLDKPLSHVGYIPEDEEIGLSMVRRKPLSHTSPSSGTVRCITEISRTILKMNGGGNGHLCYGEHHGSFSERLFNKAPF